MHPTRSLSALLLSAVFTLAGAPANAQDSQKVLRLVPQSDLKILDPMWTSAAITRNHGYNVYDTLFGVDAAGKIHPQMVDTYTTSPDGATWTFTLRKGLAFSDGAPVTSADVLASLKRWGQRDGLGQRMFQAMDQATAIDANSFRFVFKQPFGMVLDALSKPSSNPPFIMPARVAATPADQQIEDTVGSGPYIFKRDEFRPGERVVYIKNPKYVPRDEPPSGTAGGKRVYVDRIEWVVLKDAQTQANALANGEVDMLESVPAEQFQTLQANSKIELHANPTLKNTYTFQMNHLIPPFNNPKIARAATLAISQEPLMRAQFVNKDTYRACVSIYPCGSTFASDQTAGFTGKPQFAAAKALLKEAGYDGKPVVLMYPTDIASLNKVPPVMAALLKQAGFNVDLQSMDWPTLLTRRAKKDPADKGGWNAFITSWAGNENINPMYFPALSGNGENGWFGWATDDKLESLKTQFLAERDEAKRRELATAMQVRVFETGLFAPLGEYKPMTAYRKGVVSGVVDGPVGVFWNLKKE
jgi:peptide/nickel transport system substrate-binding protein